MAQKRVVTRTFGITMISLSFRSGQKEIDVNYRPIPMIEVMHAIHENLYPIYMDLGKKGNVLKIKKEFTEFIKALRREHQIPEFLLVRLPDLVLELVEFWERLQEWNLLVIYGKPFVDSLITAVFEWNFRFLLASTRLQPRRILILGETGVGKEAIARTIGTILTAAVKPTQRYIPRYIPISIPNIPDTLLESELFGYEKGAFTGAVQDRIGILEQLNPGGVLFLDEMGDASSNIQMKLLRVLQEGEFRPLGSSRMLQSRFHLLAATNRTEEYLRDRFRSDLFFRLSGSVIRVPPLRDLLCERSAAIRIIDNLINHMADEMVEGFIPEEVTWFQSWIGFWSKRAAIRIWEYMQGYEWPGNLRECNHLIRQIIMQGSLDCISGICQEYLKGKPIPFSEPENRGETVIVGDIHRILHQTERSLYEKAASRSKTIEEAASMLRVTRQTASRKLKMFGLKVG